MVMMTPSIVMTSTPSIVMTSAPSIVMTSATVMAPAMDLNDCAIIAGKCIRVGNRHCRRGQNWSERKSAGCKSDQ
jgi:hypothetical protein